MKSFVALFKGRHFDREIIVLCVRWYLTFKLSSRDLVQMMAERGILLAHTTILRWVQRYVPDFEKRWQAYARPVGNSWRVDETYIKVKGQWVYLYRAVDKAGRTVDFLLSRRRDMAAAKRFFSRATKQHGAPRVITLDGYAASHQAVAKLKTSGILPRRVQVRSCKYLNNVTSCGEKCQSFIGTNPPLRTLSSWMSATRMNTRKRMQSVLARAVLR